MGPNPNFEDIWKHYEWAQNKGVRWFAVSLDDVNKVKIDGTEHSYFVNKMVKASRKRSGSPNGILSDLLSGYSTDPKQRDYLEQLVATVDSTVFINWTGTSTSLQTAE